ncbi:Uma2 family endonuclease [Pyxidicoccus xibeiensis]|uniref:Uma2 family endonuclease n=1 Tax=Pyxidicoccus xibeiensis TaxID=2906759 RepID=UPI0020A82952|nr:Uma2 family endonuclease [Pyxidicoccus xibeiensis]MCP3139817.1 Uma2 family endonuclease [Pyxidicoccus xibeiensis]
MSEDLHVQGEEQVATNGAGPHPGDMSDKAGLELLNAARERLPEGVKGEIIDGVLYVSPNGAVPHSRAMYRLGALLGPFDLGIGGLGGWVFLVEPNLHLGEDRLEPDLAGWRRERMPELPSDVGVTLAPDWVCEVLSPSTVKLDRTLKMEVYAREGVKHYWLVNPRRYTLEVYRLEGSGWTRLGVYEGDAEVRAEPFEELALKLALLWEL